MKMTDTEELKLLSLFDSLPDKGKLVVAAFDKCVLLRQSGLMADNTFHGAIEAIVEQEFGSETRKVFCELMAVHWDKVRQSNRTYDAIYGFVQTISTICNFESSDFAIIAPDSGTVH